MINKKAILFTTLVIICTLFSKPLVLGDYQVSIGEVFTYTINNSYWNVQLGDESSTVSGCKIFSESVEKGTSFDVEVTNVTTSEDASWNLTVGSNVYSSNNDPGDLGIIHNFLFNIRIQAFYFTSFWSQEIIDMGPAAQFLFFVCIGTGNIFDFLDYISDTTSFHSEFTNTHDEYTRIEGHFDDSGTLAIFDWVVKASFDYSTPYDVHIEGSERFKIAFDKITGVMQGYRIETDSKGVVEGQEYELHMNQEITLEGYTLPTYYFKDPNKLPGFDWFISIFAISTLVISIVIIRKQKSSL